MTAEQNSKMLQRITLFVDESLENEIIVQGLRLGACSYICSYCSGKPLHNAFESATRISSLVRIELLAPLDRSAGIIEYIQYMLRRHCAVTALVDVVTPLTAGAAPAASGMETNGRRRADEYGKMLGAVESP